MIRRSVIAVAVAVALLAGCSSTNGEKSPYHDTRSTGAIALYGADGQEKTTGKLSDKPFVAKAVSQVAAPAPYDGDGRKASLLAYQPREGVDPSLWTGTYLTGASTYDDKAHPTAQAPAQGLSMAEFIEKYPTRWNGLVQLRMYLGVPNQPTLNSSYATADLKIEGDTWTLIASSPAQAAAAPGPRVGGLGLAIGVPRRDDTVPIVASVPGTDTTTTGPTSTTTTPGSPGGDLPRTGLNILLIAGVGVGLVALGASVLVAARRRRHERAGSRS